MGAQTWQRCNGMEISPFTEITIQNITEEASYQFRISAVNDYGQSQYMEVPGTFYLGETEKHLIVITPPCVIYFSPSLA